MNKDKFFKIAQAMLYRTPVIIWGSGASVPLGLPTMSDLNQALGDKIQGFDRDNNNLEDELSKSKYSDNLDEIRNIIWKKINEKQMTMETRRPKTYGTQQKQC